MRLLEGDPVEVAPRLLDAVLHGRGVSVRLTEVEAYRGEGADPGSHAFRGRTPRTEPMFGPAGTLYVYLSYGMHRCLNLVCGAAGEAGAVLLRAGEVVEGAELAAKRRAAAAPRRAGECASRLIAPRDLARGPARLATALGIDLTDSGGMLAAGPLSVEGIALEPGPLVRPERIASGPRVGVSGLGGSAEYPWRYWLVGEPTVSTYRAAISKR
ncbi:DNA-3-methyladenine glycosylase [Microcella sp.]|uniref:DNA-3-methyladenine glycosylase n=1 Tax=Microcella sp. TaxID=1913979 RepID=UPI00255D2530|nr:DNA-3-methyladenine glycosylase [Microcella sp.]MBX9470522.1 DNA-3-methyladenine glycosylase [Microcella sp.]